MKLGSSLDFNSEDSYVEPYRTDYTEYGYDGELKTLLTGEHGFIPIGVTTREASTTQSFAGIFDGDGKKISNLKINAQSNQEREVGLFATNQGTIKKIGIDNCIINANIIFETETTFYIGSICAFNTGEINSCWTSGNTNVKISGNIALRVGGIAGYSKGTAITNCYNKANILVETDGSKDTFIAGLLGVSTATTPQKCINYGNIEGTHLGTGKIYCAGVLGYGQDMKVKNCYNCGQIKGTGATNATTYIGGVAGSVPNVENSCNIGTILYEGSTKYVGAVIGALGSTVTDVYYLNNTTLNGIGRNYGATTEAILADTIDDMPTILEIVGDEFKEDTDELNKGYPILAWQTKEEINQK